MRVNLIVQPVARPKEHKKGISLSVTIRPASGYPGEYCLSTDSQSLMHMLRKQAELRPTALARFEEALTSPNCARLLGVELSDNLLTDMGYFVD